MLEQTVPGGYLPLHSRWWAPLELDDCQLRLSAKITSVITELKETEIHVVRKWVRVKAAVLSLPPSGINGILQIFQPNSV